MKKNHPPSKLMIVLLLCAGLFSCAHEKTSSVLFKDMDGTRVLRTASREGQPGSILLSKPKEVLYTFDLPVRVPQEYSLEITYAFSVPEVKSSQEAERTLAGWEDSFNLEIAFGDNQDAWVLPVSLRTLGIRPVRNMPGEISYTIPLSPGSLEFFSFRIKKNGSSFFQDKIFLELKSLELVPRWFGLIEGEDHLRATPFVYLEDTKATDTITINPAAKFRIGRPELCISGFEPVPESITGIHKNYVQIGNKVYPAEPGQKDLYFNVRTLENNPVEACGYGMNFIVLQSSENRAYPLNPVTISPGDVVSYSRDKWRMEQYEIFKWDQFPQILIFDTADYRVQDRLFKRLAFFVEKAGFQGTLSRDEEIAHLHGWNAHDYRAEDLALFFQTARETNFPLNQEEMELRQVLLDQHIILQDEDSNIIPGTGAIISISQESPGYLRYLFIVHEGYHGLFFIDKEFEAFALSRWKNLDPAARVFISQYFASQRYDTENEYLMSNELMAYCLQQSVSMAGDYFGKNLAGRIYANPERRRVLPARDPETNSWPLLSELFTKEAQAFSEYVNHRWGLRAGSLKP